MISRLQPVTFRAGPITVLLMLLLNMAASSTILLVPFPSYSHINPLVTLGEILLEKGHNVHIYVPSLYGHLAHLKANTKIKVMEYQVKAWEWNAAMHAGKIDTETDYFDYVTQTSYLSDLKAKYNGYYLLCKALMSSRIIDLHIKHGVTFDLGIVDNHPLTRCHYALMYKHGIPYVSYSQVYDPWLSHSPAMPSYVSSFLTAQLTDKMSFWQRIINTWMVLYWGMGNHLPAQSQEFIADYVTGKPPITTDELALESRLWLSDTNFLLDYSRPMVANEVLVSWALMKEAKLLPKDHTSLERINKTKDGIIIVSLDQNIALPGRVVTAILTSFKLFQSYHIIWQYNGDLTEETIAPNVKVMPYIPLNDLLGHPKTKLLVTSADSYHQNMALYHGVPVLCVPLHPAQRHNARKTEYRQQGLVISPDEFSLKSLVQAMKKLVTNDTHYRNIQETSRIMKMQQPTAQKSLRDWIELSLANDFVELRPYAIEMPWHRYFMFDVMLLAAIIAGNIIFLLSSSAILGIKRLKQMYKKQKLFDPGTNSKQAKATAPLTPGSNNKPQGATPSTTAAAIPNKSITSKPFKQH